MKILTLLFCLIATSFCYAQSTLREVLSTADSVVIISHKDLYRKRTLRDIKNGTTTRMIQLLDSTNRLLDSLVLERLTIKKNEIDSLCEILLLKKTDEPPFSGAVCFIPHHAILVYKNSEVSAIDICFKCGTFSMLGFLKLRLKDKILQCESSWIQLDKFFEDRQVNRMPVEWVSPR